MTTRGRYNPPSAPFVEVDPIFGASYASGITGVDGTTIERTLGVLNVKSGVYQPAGSYITLASLSGTAPITYNNGTGAIGITSPLPVANGGTGFALTGANQIPFMNASNTALSSSANLTFDGSDLLVTGSGQFNNIGIGVSPSTVNAATINFSASSTTVKGISLSVVNIKNTAGTSLCTGVDFQSIFKPVFTGTQFARSISTLHGGTGIAQIAVNTGGTVNTTGVNVRAFYGQVQAFDVDSGGGVANITTGTSFYAVAATKGLGTITTLYSFYDAGQTVATNNWGIVANTVRNHIQALNIGGTFSITNTMSDGTLTISGLTTATGGVTIGASGGITMTTNDLTITCAADKTIVLAETVWDDLPPSPIIGAKLGSSEPTLATFISDIEQYTFDAVNDYVIGTTEITHKWKEGTTIYPHIHWATNGTNTDERKVKWQLKYTIGDAMEVFAAQATTVVDATIPANTADRTHLITNFDTAITGTGYRIGAQIVWRLERITSAGTAPTNDPFGIAVGFHVEMDTMGSRTITGK